MKKASADDSKSSTRQVQEAAKKYTSFVKLGHEECFSCETFSLHEKNSDHSRLNLSETDVSNVKPGKTTNKNMEVPELNFLFSRPSEELVPDAIDLLLQPKTCTGEDEVVENEVDDDEYDLIWDSDDAMNTEEEDV
ncbi:hypothetical protein ILUMI_24876 [Ignelater luminosus]|uniref:Uncharacterized protein n=1 Tax=Ignelater luminosus TaxID=2038154 RepID=A0A8K0C9M5_IGNLU|nr:hypothetical protein ILUMI_24876 [Ignelater luminosus]